MKVLTIQSPWADKIYDGLKTIETRTWTTKHRGDILLHCSKKPDSPLSGCIFGVAELYHIEPMTKEHEKDAGCEVYPKANAWHLRNFRKTELKFVKGNLGLWELNAEVRQKDPLGESKGLACLFR